MPSDIPQHDSPQELARRVENLARLGTVVAVRHGAPARCRVQLGENTTDWLPWLAGRAAAGQGARWWPPVVGEQCLVLAPGGDLAQGIVLLGVYSDRMPAPSDGAAVERLQWSETDHAEYRDGQHTTHTEQAIVLEVGTGCRITLSADTITLQAGGAVLQIGPDQITSNVDIVAQGISATTHKHTGVVPGGAVSQGPVA